MKRGIPDRGDILHLNLDPVLGKEQQGQRYVTILNGEILEEYPDLGLGESCFILGIAG
jgi:mRNA-degrading endonuclease toxin of MazEF toxin-antitoxin module